MSRTQNSPQQHTQHIRQSRNDRWVRVLAYTVVGLFGLICLYPLLLTVTVSLTACLPPLSPISMPMRW